MLYSRDHVWIDESDPARAKVGITSQFSGDMDPVPIRAPVDFSIVSFRDNIPLRELNGDPEGAGYIAVVNCSNPAQLRNLMTAAEYRVFCQGVDDSWSATNNPVRFPPDPYVEGETFATVNGS
jgi:glycine cleavage system H lipoate-binding protein